MKQIPIQGTKVCRTCKIEKHVLAFASDPSTHDHLQGECRDCVGVRNKMRYAKRRSARKAPLDFSIASGRTRDLKPAVKPPGLQHSPPKE